MYPEGARVKLQFHKSNAFFIFDGLYGTVISAYVLSDGSRRYDVRIEYRDRGLTLEVYGYEVWKPNIPSVEGRGN